MIEQTKSQQGSDKHGPLETVGESPVQLSQFPLISEESSVLKRKKK